METRILYEGHRRIYGERHEITVRYEPEGRVTPLFPSWNHGWDWGYVGDKAKQLALAVLYDATGDESLSLRHCSDFNFLVTANWEDDWCIRRDEILEWLDSRESRILAENICQN